MRSSTTSLDSYTRVSRESKEERGRERKDNVAATERDGRKPSKKGERERKEKIDARDAKKLWERTTRNGETRDRDSSDDISVC